MSIYPLFLMNKYFNKKTVVDGIKFDSRKEAKRYSELCLMQKAGLISYLRTQVSFELIPNQYKNGKVLFRRRCYIADFVYVDEKTGKTVVEDVKGMKTQLYLLKKALMYERYQIEVQET